MALSRRALFYFLSKTLDVLLSPLTWAIGLALIGVRFDRRGWTRWTPLGAAGVLCVFSMPPVANLLVWHLERLTLRSMRPGVTYDAIIVLGGAVDHGATETWGSTSYNDNVERLLVTFDLLRKGRARHAILSGGRSNASDPVVEARVLARQLVEWGVPPGQLILDDRARNTRENAVFSQRLASERGFHSLLLVTSAFHMPRALDAFRTVGLTVDVLPVDHRSFDPARTGANWLPRSDSLAESSHAIREIFGRWIYRLMW